MKSGASFYIRNFLPLIILAAAVLLFYFFAVVPEMNRVEELKAEIEEAEREIEDARAIAASASEMRDENQKLREREQALMRKVPDQANISRIVREVSEKLNRPGTRVLSLSPREEPPENGAGRVLLDISLRTDFISLGEIMKGIENSELLFTVSRMELSKVPGRRELEARITLASYYRN